jgi:hypothetical protein
MADSHDLPTCQDGTSVPKVSKYVKNKYIILKNHFLHTEVDETNDRVELAITYRWTGWVLRNNRLRSKTAGKLQIMLEESIEECTQFNKGKPEDVNIHVTGWTCKHQDLNRLR